MMDYQTLLERTADPRPRPASAVPPVYAFPASVDVAANQRGMTLRDVFAGQIMAALIADGRDVPLPQGEQAMAVAAYRMADYLLAAREGR